MLAGDFNVHSALWGFRRGNRRDGILEDWATQLGLVLLNRGSASICVRPQEESIVDLTWLTLGAAPFRDWRVAVEIETISDHEVIEDLRHRNAGALAPHSSGVPCTEIVAAPLWTATA